jgi:hypothetical protein
MNQVDLIADQLNEAKLIRKMTTLEKSRVALKFVTMHEHPERFMALNKYVERSTSLIQTLKQGLNQENEH